MTTNFDAEIAALVTEVLSGARNGTTVTYSSVSRSYSAASGESVETVTDYSVQASPPSPARGFGQDTVEDGDASTIIPASGLPFTPTAGDRVTIDATPWQVVLVDAIRAQDDVVAYKLRLRQ